MRPRRPVTREHLYRELEGWREVERQAARDPHYSNRYRVQGAIIALSMLIEAIEERYVSSLDAAAPGAHHEAALRERRGPGRTARDGRGIIAPASRYVGGVV